MNSISDGSGKKKAILDSNVIYSALYKPEGVCGRIILFGIGLSLELYSIDLAREELRLNLARKMGMRREQIESILTALPLHWIPREAYRQHLRKAVRIVGNDADAAFVAAALATRIPLVTGDKHLLTDRVRSFIRTYRPRDALRLLG